MTLVRFLLMFGLIAGIALASGSQPLEAPRDGPLVEVPSAQGERASGQNTAAKGSVGISARAPVPADALSLALQDAATLPFIDRLFTRWIWCRDGKLEDWKSVVYGIQFISRASHPVRPLPLAQGVLLRIDLRHFWPRDRDIRDVIVSWEKFAFDPAFSQLVTKDTLDLINIPLESLPKVHHRGLRKEHRTIPSKKKDAPDEDQEIDVPFDEWLPFSKESTANVVRINPPHIALPLSALQGITFSQAPIVEYRYFLSRSLTSIRRSVGEKKDGLFADLYGGLYYELRGIKKSTQQGVTDRDLFFAQFLRIGNIKGGEKFADVFEEARSDQRSVIVISDITGKPRRVDIFPTLAQKGGGAGYITSDPKDEDIDVAFNSQLNLLDGLKFRAQEGIFFDSKNIPLTVLFNERGELQDEVPAEVAADRTIPQPYTTRLQPPIGCIRCHGPNEFMMPLDSAVKKVLDTKKFDILGDISKLDVSITDVQDRLVGLYAENVNEPLRLSRNVFAAAVLKVTGPWPKSPDQADVGKLVCKQLGDIYADYWYTPVTPEIACKELGVNPPPGKALEILNLLLSPDGAFADARLAALQTGIAINRNDWNLSYGFAAARAAGPRQVILKALEKK